MWEICFEKSKALNNFINDISKSRNRVFYSTKYGKLEGAWYFISSADLWGGGERII